MSSRIPMPCSWRGKIRPARMPKSSGASGHFTVPPRVLPPPVRKPPLKSSCRRSKASAANPIASEDRKRLAERPHLRPSLLGSNPCYASSRPLWASSAFHLRFSFFTRSYLRLVDIGSQLAVSSFHFSFSAPLSQIEANFDICGIWH